jgi:SPP1 family predicted phage head-tail adaptor
MQVGKLRYRIDLQAPPVGQDIDGDPNTEWTSAGTVWAAKEDLTGRELFAAQAVQSEISTRFRIRYRDGIVPSMRIVCDDIIYNIAAVLDRDGTRRELQLMCSSEVNDG